MSYMQIFAFANLIGVINAILQAVSKDVLMNKNVTPFELAFLRSSFNAISSAFIIYSLNQSLRDPKVFTGARGLIWRSLSGTVCFLFYAISVEYLPLSIFLIIYQSSPLIIAVIAWLWLNEKISYREILIMLVAFSGVVIVGLGKAQGEEESETESPEVVESYSNFI